MKSSGIGASMLFGAALLLMASACSRENYFPEIAPEFGNGRLFNRVPRTLALNDEVTGRLTRKTSVNVYTVSIPEEGLYQFDMRSEKLDAYLELEGQDVNFSNDDSGEGLNARLVAYLQPGAYQLRASTIADAATGIYTLRFSAKPLPEGISLRNDGILRPDSTILGLHAGQPQEYTLTLPHRAFVVIEMKSEDIDSLLEISGNGIEEKDDDSGKHFDAHLVQILEPGEYTVTAGAIDSQASGLYTIQTRQLDIDASAPRAPIGPGAVIEGRIAAGGIDTINLQIRHAGNYIIDMLSADFDSVLEIHGESLDERHDDGYEDTPHARLALALAPGEYRLHAKAFDADEKGRYVLLVSNPNQASRID